MRALVVDPSLFTLPYDREFCRGLAGRGVETTLVGRPLRHYEALAGEPFAFKPLFYRGITGHETGWRTSRLGRIRKGFEHVSGLRALMALAAEEATDIVHFQWLMLPLLDRLALARLRPRAGLVLTVHNAELTAHSTSAVVGRLGAVLQVLGQSDAVMAFDRYIAHTTKTVTQLERLGIEPERIILLPHPPLNLDAQPSPPAEPATDHRRDILLFGSIKPYKGVDVLIEAGISMAARRHDFRITIAGRPFQPLDELRARIEAAGAAAAFRFDLDYLPDERLAGYLDRAAAIVFPYREIDGSGALALATRFGKPIVASRIGVFGEAPVKDHVALVPPGNPQALATTLETLLDDEARCHALAGLSRRLEALLPSWSDFARACHTAYAGILEERRAG
ncbi:MAG: glycosyltransferase [Geminicoccaceae bacterium]